MFSLFNKTSDCGAKGFKILFCITEYGLAIELQVKYILYQSQHIFWINTYLFYNVLLFKQCTVKLQRRNQNLQISSDPQ